MGDLLQETHSEVFKISDLLSSMKNQITKNYKETTSRLTALETELQEERAARLTSEAERSRLQARVTELTRELSAAAWQGFRGKASQPTPPVVSAAATASPAAPPSSPSPPPRRPTRGLLLGNSLLRNVDPTRLKDTEVRALSGATVEHLTGEVEKLSKDSYKHIYLVAGTREVVHSSDSETLAHYDALISASKEVATHVTICSIPHRVDKDLLMKTDGLNKDLKALCDNKNVLYADADDQLLLRDGSINSAALGNDGIHMSKHGLDALMKSLKVPTKTQGSVYTPTLYPTRGKNTQKTSSAAPPSNAHSKQRRPSSTRYFKGKGDILSNFYPCSLHSQGLWFHSSEQLIQYRWARIARCDDVAQQIMEAPDGPSVYEIARQIPRTRRWESLKEKVIKEAVELKFKSCAEFREELLSTTGSIVEDTPHPYWGRGPDYRGQNRTGLILEALRDGNRSSQPAFADLRPQYTHQRSTSPTCTNCGETNHTTHRCRYDVMLQCESCLSYGHKSKDCGNLNF